PPRSPPRPVGDEPHPVSELSQEQALFKSRVAAADHQQLGRPAVERAGAGGTAIQRAATPPSPLPPPAEGRPPGGGETPPPPPGRLPYPGNPTTRGGGAGGDEH